MLMMQHKIYVDEYLINKTRKRINLKKKKRVATQENNIHPLAYNNDIGNELLNLRKKTFKTFLLKEI